MLAQLDLLYDNGDMSKSWLAALLIGTGILSILVAAGYAVFLGRFDQKEPAPLPGDIAGMSLRGQVLGAPALAELSWMHGQEFQLNQGAVGSYGMGNEITLYVAGTPLSYTAARMISDMRDKIKQAETPFTPLGEREHGRRTIYELVGMGQQHFYFRSGNLVVWLAVAGEDAELALQQALDFYP